MKAESSTPLCPSRITASLDSDKLINSMPFAVFQRDDNYCITGCNLAFRQLFCNETNEDTKCYKAIFGSSRNYPCENCLIENVLRNSHSSSREISIDRNGSRKYFRIMAVPIFADDGSIESVYEYIEDITSRISAEERISKYSNHLESLTERSIADLRKNELSLSHMSGSFHEINMSKDYNTLVSEIANGFIKFRSLPLFFAPYDSENKTITSVSMFPSAHNLKHDNKIRPASTAKSSPFNESAKKGIFTVYNGRENVENFISSSFKKCDSGFIDNIRTILEDKMILVMPLSTESSIEAVVAICVNPTHMMDYFDTYRHLAKYSAMSLARHTSTARAHQAQMMTILSLVKLMEFRDIETGQHLERLMKYSEMLTRECAVNENFSNHINERFISDIINSCLLHDIGKVGIPDHILKKPSKLTPEEFEIMKQHVIFGGQSLVEAEKKIKGRSFLKMSKEIAFFHHEWWNGAGYPHGLKGDSIPLSARIVAVVDVYDALRSHRPYKEALSHDESCRIIHSESGTHFDPRIVEAFMRREKSFLEQSAI